MAAPTRTRWWIATWNNPPQDQTPFDLGIKSEKILFISGQKERGESGTEHYQFIMHLKDHQRLSFLKTIHPTIHWQGCISPESQYSYCHKEESRIATFPDYGAKPTSLSNKKSMVKREPLPKATTLKTKSFEEIAMECSYSAYNSAVKAKAHIENQAYIKIKPKIAEIRGECFFGDSGVGKTTGLQRLHWNNITTKSPANKWFDGYERGQFLLIDDITPKHFTLKDWDLADCLKHLADGYPFQAETKGGFLKDLQVPKTFITTQYTWEELIPSDIKLRTALERRYPVTEVTLTNRDSLFKIVFSQ